MVPEARLSGVEPDSRMPRPQPRPGILAMPEYMRGLATVDGVERVVKLSSNENPFGPSPRAIAAAHDAIGAMHLYPEAGSGALRSAIGAYYGLDPARIFCGAGSDQILSLLALAYAGPGDEVVFNANGYGRFRLYAMAAGATPVAVPDRGFVADVGAFLGCVTARTRLVMLANPDNPLSTYLPFSEIRRLHADLADDVLFVLDGAYADYVTAPDYAPGEALVDAAANVVMARTFSKIFGLAAMRLGWVYAPRYVIEVLERLEPSFPITGPATAAGIAALGDRDHAARSREHNAEWRRRFGDRLALLGLTVFPSQTNFVLARFPQDHPRARTAAAANEFLLDRGIIARRFVAPAFADCLRITIGSAADMTAAGDALAEFLER